MNDSGSALVIEVGGVQGKIVHEVVGAELPPEPPVGTVIVDAKGTLYQLTVWHRFDIVLSSYAAWSSVGERQKRREAPTWTELLNRGPVTVLWRPEPEPPTS